MRTRLMGVAVVLAGLALAAVAGARQEAGVKQAGGDTKAVDKQIYDVLREVITTGRDLFNKYGDYSGCYRVFQGSLLTVKPLLAHRPDLQKAIDRGMADAEQMSYVHQRAFALRKVLDTVRAGLKSGETVVEVPEKIKPLPRPEKTEWERLGGVEKVRRIVEDVSAAVAQDPKVNVTRDGKYKFTEQQVAAMKQKLVELVSEITGGPLTYTGKSMKDAHEGMGITDAEFDAFMGHLLAALKKNAVAPAEIESLRKKIEGTRPEIVEKQKSEEKKGEEKKQKTASVTGTILYKGQPLPAGTISFNKAKDVYAAKIQADGTYSLNVPPGSYTVAIETASVKAPKKAGKDGGQDPPPRFVAIPAAYGDPLRSGLTVEVKAGKNNLDFELK